MPRGWYLKVADKEVGPLNPKQLQAMAKRGQLEPEDLVRRGMTGKWVAARRVKGLLSEKASTSEAESTTKPVDQPDATPIAKPLEQPPASQDTIQITGGESPPPEPTQQAAPTPEPFTAPQPPVAPAIDPNAPIPQAQIPVAAPVGQVPLQPGVAPAVAQVAPTNAPQPFEISAESPTARTTGRRRRSGNPNKRKQRNRTLTMVLLVLAVVAVAGVGVGMVLWKQPVNSPKALEKDLVEPPAGESDEKAPDKERDFGIDIDSIDLSPEKPKPKTPDETPLTPPFPENPEEPAEANPEEPAEANPEEPVEEEPEDDGGQIAIPGLSTGPSEEGEEENPGFEDDPKMMERSEAVREALEANQETNRAGGRNPRSRGR